MLTGIKMTHILCHTIYPYCDANQYKPFTNSCNQFIHSVECGQYAAKMKQENMNLYKLLVSRCDTSHRSGGNGPECILLSIHASKNGIYIHTIIFYILFISRSNRENSGHTAVSCMKGNEHGYSGNQIGIPLPITFVKCTWRVQSPRAGIQVD